MPGSAATMPPLPDILTTNFDDPISASLQTSKLRLILLLLINNGKKASHGLRGEPVGRDLRRGDIRLTTSCDRLTMEWPFSQGSGISLLRSTRSAPRAR